MASILDIPLFCLPFLTLVHLTVLSKECCAKSRDALTIKNRGHEMLTYLASLPMEKRASIVMNSISIHDVWILWKQVGLKTFGRHVDTIIFQKAEPCEVDICTTHRNEQFNMEVSSQFVIRMDTPYIMFGGLTGFLHPSIEAATTSWINVIEMMIKANQYDDVWWRTAPLTFFEIDLMFSACWRHNNIVVGSMDGEVHASTPYDRFRVSANSVRSYLTIFADFFVQTV
jgi:hypothetical protein